MANVYRIKFYRTYRCSVFVTGVDREDAEDNFYSRGFIERDVVTHDHEDDDKIYDVEKIEAEFYIPEPEREDEL